MADILLANSYFLYHDPKEFRAMNLYAPLGTLYASAYLAQKGYNVAVFDTMLAKSESELESELKKHKPEIFIVYDDVFNYLTKMCLTRMREAAFNMIKIAKDFGCKVIVSGSDVHDHLEKYFMHNADYAICGEGEITAGEIADYIFAKSGRQPEEINGLAFLKNNAIHKTPGRNVLKNLDSMPFPQWDLIDVGRYKDLWMKHHGYFSMNLVTTRGCPFHCNWCAKPIYGQIYNSRSPENVAKEMKFLKENYSPDHIWFCDDIFGLKPGWVPEFDKVVNTENTKISYKCLSRADLLLKEDGVRHLASSGCTSIWIGAESGAQKILDAMEKGTKIEQIYRARKLLKDNNIRTCFFLQFGYSGETRKEIEMTLKMVRETMPDDIGISVSYPLPGTKFYERVSTQMGDKKNWVDSSDFEIMFDGEYTSDFYRILHKYIHKEFRSRHIIKNPFGHIKNLWKLPYYVFGWIIYSRKLRKLYKTERRNEYAILN
jgi:anaerobic magnesium-protoporphyrin IX monomethyl ester cyclase